MQHNVKEYLKSFNLLSENDIDEFIKLSTSRVLKKGQHFITQGEICHEVCFIKSGLLRSYYYSTEKREAITSCFYFSNTFLTAYSSLISGLPSPESIEALSDIEMLSISKTNFIALEENNISWLKFSKFISEQEYLALEKRIHLLQSESAETKYNHLLKNHSEYLQHIPLKYLASYLGITQRHLSRIRRSI